MSCCKFEYKYYDALVVGGGAAGLTAACRIARSKKKRVAVISDKLRCEYPSNTEVDLQSYCKVGLGGSEPDSVMTMTDDLFCCGAVDGDNALCEAALSSQCFFYLCELGVEFPVSRYGEYIGCKPDNDRYAREISAGPLTAECVFEVLKAEAHRLKVEIIENLRVIEVLTDGSGVLGVTCIAPNGDLSFYACPNIVLSTEDSAGIYRDSLCSGNNSGGLSLVLNAGASLQNMTEWQFCLASVSHNQILSGAYMQAIPRFVSVDGNGCEHDFLREHFYGIERAVHCIFQKGRQWQFDSARLPEGSSLIDLFVWRECEMLGRRVYLDYTENPFGITDFSLLSALPDEANELFKTSELCKSKPIDRLKAINGQSVDLLASKGIDLSTEYLEITLSALQCNGGAAVDSRWQTSVSGLYAIGECAGTHGIRRLGGSSLTVGQVGALRAAQHICSPNGRRELNVEAFVNAAKISYEKHSELCKSILKNRPNLTECIAEAAKRMTAVGGAVREERAICRAIKETEGEIARFKRYIGVGDRSKLSLAYKLLDILQVQAATLTSMQAYFCHFGSTRGSAVYSDSRGMAPKTVEDIFGFIADSGKSGCEIGEVAYRMGRLVTSFRNVRPIPEDDRFEALLS